MNALAFSREEVLAIHATVIERFGGLGGLRDEGLLDSALAQPFQTFGGTDLYPSAIDKARRYTFDIISNHPFLDGNKRTGTALLGAYLRMSGSISDPTMLLSSRSCWVLRTDQYATKCSPSGSKT